MTKRENSYRIVIAGDLFPSKSNIDHFIKGDVSWLFGKEISQIFDSSDYRICNLEGVFTHNDNPIDKIGPCIKNTPDSILAIKKLGVDLLVTANNHVTDYGMSGYIETKKTLADNDIRFIGSGCVAQDIINFVQIDANGKSVCIYNVAEEMFNVLDDSMPGVNLYDEYRVCKEIEQLKLSNDYVIVIYHGGTEYFPYPTPELKKRFHRMADCGADIVVAQHTHCIGCEERYNDSYLLYGQGNFLFDRQKTPITHNGLFLEIEIDDRLEIFKHYFHVLNGQLYYDADSGEKMLQERSLHVSDTKYIEKMYADFVTTQIKDLTKEWAKKGLVYRVLRRYFPNYPVLFARKIKYRQLLSLYYYLKSEQKRETVLNLIKINLTGDDKWLF